MAAKCMNCNKEIITTKNRIEKHGRNSCSVKCRNSLLKTKYLGEGNPMYGTKLSDERIKQISDTSKKIWKNQTFREHIKECAKNYYEINKYYYGNSPESNNKRKESYIKNYGVDHNWKNKENKKNIKFSLNHFNSGVYINKINKSKGEIFRKKKKK